jgi:hypothetical protein
MVLVAVVLGVLATTLDLIGAAIRLWMFTLPAVLALGAAIYWALTRWDPPDPQAEPAPHREQVLYRLAQTGMSLGVVAIGIGVIVAAGRFLWGHKEYLVFGGMVLLFFVGVALWSLKPSPAATAEPDPQARPRRRRGGDSAG